MAEIDWGKKLQEARTKRALSQDEVAQRFGISQWSVSAIERGAVAPHPDVQARIVAFEAGTTFAPLSFKPRAPAKGPAPTRRPVPAARSASPRRAVRVAPPAVAPGDALAALVAAATRVRTLRADLVAAETALSTAVTRCRGELADVVTVAVVDRLRTAGKGGRKA